MWDWFLAILCNALEVLIDVYTTKDTKLWTRLLTIFFSLICLAFVVFLTWNSIHLFSQGRVIGGVILGVLALIGTISSMVFIVYFHKKGWL